MWASLKSEKFSKRVGCLTLMYYIQVPLDHLSCLVNILQASCLLLQRFFHVFNKMYYFLKLWLFLVLCISSIFPTIVQHLWRVLFYVFGMIAFSRLPTIHFSIFHPMGFCLVWGFLCHSHSFGQSSHLNLFTNISFTYDRCYGTYRH